MPELLQIQFPQDTDAALRASKTIYAAGEPAYARDTKILKIGDGTNLWRNLPVYGGEAIELAQAAQAVATLAQQSAAAAAAAAQIDKQAVIAEAARAKAAADAAAASRSSVTTLASDAATSRTQAQTYRDTAQTAATSALNGAVRAEQAKAGTEAIIAATTYDLATATAARIAAEQARAAAVAAKNTTVESVNRAEDIEASAAASRQEAANSAARAESAAIRAGEQAQVIVDGVLNGDTVKVVVDEAVNVAVSGLPIISPTDVDAKIGTAIGGLSFASTADVDNVVQARIGELSYVSPTELDTKVSAAILSAGGVSPELVQAAVQEAVAGIDVATTGLVDTKIGEAIVGFVRPEEVDTKIGTAIAVLPTSDVVDTKIGTAIAPLPTEQVVDSKISTAIAPLPTEQVVDTKISTALGGLQIPTEESVTATAGSVAASVADARIATLSIPDDDYIDGRIANVLSAEDRVKLAEILQINVDQLNALLASSPHITVDWPDASDVGPIVDGTTVEEIVARFVEATVATFFGVEVTITGVLGFAGSDPVVEDDIINSITLTAEADGAPTVSRTIPLEIVVVPRRPILAPIFPQKIYINGAAVDGDATLGAQYIDGAVWSVTGPYLSITQDGQWLLEPGEGTEVTLDVPHSITARVGEFETTVTFNVSRVVAPPRIVITREPTTAGLDGLTTLNTGDEALAAWIAEGGNPEGTATNGEPVGYAHRIVIETSEMEDTSKLLLGGQGVIKTTMTALDPDAPEGQDFITAETVTLPFTVAADIDQPEITGTGSTLREPDIIAGTGILYELQQSTDGVYEAPDGAPVTIESSQMILNGQVVTDLLTETAVGDKLARRDLVTSPDVASRQITGPEKIAIIATIDILTEATVGTLRAGMSESQVIALVKVGTAEANNGRTVALKATALRNGAAFDGSVLAEGDAVRVVVSRTARSAADKNTTFDLVAQAAVAQGGGLPATGPLTLAQVESLRTDGTLRGVPAGTNLKKIGTDPLPAGMTVSGARIDIPQSADIPALDGWDFQNYYFEVRGRVRDWTNCLHGGKNNPVNATIMLRETARVDRMDWNSFLAPGYYGEISDQTVIRAYTKIGLLYGAKVDVIEHNEFYGFGDDAIKSCWSGVIRLNYFDTPTNLPAGTTVWNSSTNYAVGTIVVDPTGKYAYRALTSGSGKALPSALSSNSNWQVIDPHSDCINPVCQFDPNNPLIIEGNYINRSEAIRAVDPGARRVVGITNGIRPIRDYDNGLPMHEVIMRNNVVTAQDRNNDPWPFTLAHITRANTKPQILRDSWAGFTRGGEVADPRTTAGHTITNVVNYTTPTTPSAGYQETGVPSSGGGQPAPDPTPPPVVDTSSTAIVLVWSQSEWAFLTDNAEYSRATRPALKAENMVVYYSDGAYDKVGPVKKVRLTEATKTQVNCAIVYLANALAHICPGKQFVLVAANESGSSRVSLATDAEWPAPKDDGTKQDRRWIHTQKMVDAVLADYPQGIDRVMEYWWASDRALMNQWLKEFAPLYFGQYADGSRYNLGDVHTTSLRKQTVDHCFWDFETSDPTQKGRGLLPRTVKLDVYKKAVWGGETKSWWDGVQAFANDTRFKTLGGVYGHAPFGWIRGGVDPVNRFDNSHPNMRDPEGHVEAIYEFALPTMLRAAGIPIKQPGFIGVFTAPDGSYADVTFNAPNGGRLSTPQKIRGGSTDPNASLANEIWGFEIERASGGGKYFIARPGASGIDAKYQGTVKELNGKARITMVQPLQNGDKITYFWGRWAHRTDYPGRGERSEDAGYYRCIAIEYVSAYTDTTSSFPFAGFLAQDISPTWPVQRGAYVGQQASQPSAPTTPPTGGGGTPGTPTAYFRNTGSGPYFVDGSYVHADATRVRHKVTMRRRSDIGGTPTGDIINMSDGQLTIGASSFNGGRVFISHVSPTNSAGSVTPSERTIHYWTPGEWFTFDFWVDGSTSQVAWSVNGGSYLIQPTSSPLNGISDQSLICYLGNNTGGNLLQAGFEFALLESYRTVGGVESLKMRVEGDAATVNALSTKRGGNAT